MFDKIFYTFLFIILGLIGTILILNIYSMSKNNKILSSYCSDKGMLYVEISDKAYCVEDDQKLYKIKWLSDKVEK